MSGRKTAKPVEAWAVFDGRDEFVELIDGELTDAEREKERAWWDSHADVYAPHRVARVRIEEIAP